MTTGQWITLILVALGAFALIAGVTSYMTRRTAKQQDQQNADRRVTGEIVGLSRWLVDQGSIDVLRATDKQQLDTAWQSVRARAVDLDNRCNATAGSVDRSNLSDALHALAISVAGLRGALETSVQLREDPNANAMGTLIDENARTVSQRRQDVQSATDALAHAAN